MFRFKKRYAFWKVFWVTLTIYVCLGLVALVMISLVPKEAEKIPDFFQRRFIIRTGASVLYTIIFLYFATNYYYHFISEKLKPVSYLPFSLIMIFICIGYHLGSYFLLPLEKQSEISPVSVVVAGVIINTIFFLGLSFLIAYLTKLRDEQKQRKILEEQKLQLEVEKTQANFNFLKAQINPHFLHNTLNFLYAKSLPYSSELSEGILTLSDIMRYALSEGNATDGKAPLKDEIEHVRNVIKINQLRFNNNLNVKFNVEGVVNGATIIPFVLITLVENAFKHGDLKSSENPIEINLLIKDHYLSFHCRNKKKNGPKELSTGIGLENIKKRLELAYGKDYSLRVNEDANFYSTELTITEL